MVPYKEERKPRKFGQLEGKVKIPKDLDKESDEINSIFYGSKI